MRQTGRRRVGAIVLTVGVGLIADVFAQYPGWLIPAGGKDEKSPVTSPVAAASRGKALFLSNCARCHGPEGKGDGPDSDHAADLTDDLRDELNTEGVLFYKVWNGRSSPRMPNFEDQLSKEQAWAVVAYVQTLRKKS